MVIAITVVPVLEMIEMGGLGTTMTAMAVQDIPINLFGNGISVLAILSAVAWGLGYFGQPHILVSFMGIRSIKDLPKSMTIAIVWVIVSLAGAILVGLLSIPLFPGLSGGSQETVFILMIRQYFPVWIGGIFLAAIMAAIMSTIDSQLLVSSSALTEDLWNVFAKKSLSDKMSVNIGRGAVVVIAVLAMLLALQDNASVMGLVSYAWSGFGAAFGLLVLFGLYSRKTTGQAALSWMVVGTLTVVIWKMTGMSSLMYEIVPGFLLNVVVILIVNRLTQPNPECMKEFDEMVAIVAAAKTEGK
ncbi:sodium:solute symporter family transporter [Eubacterium aggregans]|uniref:sodium:solute symporter family transporter n=1 Tax=Eubacterium aggregans TaxID=81409 RepID=UPI003F379E15